MKELLRSVYRDGYNATYNEILRESRLLCTFFYSATQNAEHAVEGLSLALYPNHTLRSDYGLTPMLYALAGTWGEPEHGNRTAAEDPEREVEESHRRRDGAIHEGIQLFPPRNDNRMSRPRVGA